MPAEVGIKFFGIAISSDGKTIAAASMPPTVIELCQPKNLSSQYGGIELRQIPFDVASVGDCFAFLEVSDIELWCRRGAM